MTRKPGGHSESAVQSYKIMTSISKETKKSEPRLSRRRFLTGSAIGFGGLVLGDALFREPEHFQVEELLLPLAKIPPGRELRLVQISDLHIRAFYGYRNNFV